MRFLLLQYYAWDAKVDFSLIIIHILPQRLYNILFCIYEVRRYSVKDLRLQRLIFLGKKI